MTFRSDVPIGETMHFEAVYEETLQLDREYKTMIVRDGIAVWMYVDGVLAGETYGISPAKIDEDIEDVPARDPHVMYCYSTTLLPQFQGKNLSKILCSYWLGMVKAAGYRAVVGHTTSPAMTAVKAFFGGTFSAEHRNWYGTKRVAHFYRIAL